MKVLNHHIYEYKKGLRNLVLHTMKASYKKEVEARMEGNGITYIIEEVTPEKINVFFGAPECIEVIRSFSHKKLNELTSEEDFILGTMLGYGLLQQCNRYSKRKLLSQKMKICG